MPFYGPGARALRDGSACGHRARERRLPRRERPGGCRFASGDEHAPPRFAVWTACSTILAVARKPSYRAIAAIDPDELATFQAGIRKRYTDEQILDALRACAGRLGRSPTMKEFGADPETAVHPQTVIEHFGSWNAAQRAAGLVPRRFATREELLALLKQLGDDLGRTPTARDIDARRGRMPSKSLYWHTFGSLSTPSARPDSTWRSGRSGSSARSRRALRWRGGSGGCHVRGLGRGAPRRRRDADRVAGLPHVRLTPWGVGDVPVPRSRAADRRRRRRPRRRCRWPPRTPRRSRRAA